MFEKFTLPSHLASYLVNSDSSALEESEINEIDAWISEQLDSQKKEHGKDAMFYCVNVSYDSEFKSYNDLNNMGGDCSEYTFLLK